MHVPMPMKRYQFKKKKDVKTSHKFGAFLIGGCFSVSATI
jgi:hypothetical protein